MLKIHIEYIFKIKPSYPLKILAKEIQYNCIPEFLLQPLVLQSTSAQFLFLVKNHERTVTGVFFQKRNLPQRENFYVRHEGSNFSTMPQWQKSNEE